MAKTIYVGDTITMTLQLRTKDLVNPDLENYFPLPATRTIVAKLPGNVSSVVASSANPGEITVVDAAKSTITAVWVPANTINLKEGVAAVDVVVTDTGVVPNVVTTFEKLKVVTIKSAENP